MQTRNRIASVTAQLMNQEWNPSQGLPGATVLEYWELADDATVLLNAGKVEQWDGKIGGLLSWIQAGASQRPTYVADHFGTNKPGAYFPAAGGVWLYSNAAAGLVQAQPMGLAVAFQWAQYPSVPMQYMIRSNGWVNHWMSLSAYTYTTPDPDQMILSARGSTFKDATPFSDLSSDVGVLGAVFNGVTSNVWYESATETASASGDLGTNPIAWGYTSLGRDGISSASYFRDGYLAAVVAWLETDGGTDRTARWELIKAYLRRQVGI